MPAPLPTWKPGQEISHADLNELSRAITKMIVGGRGVRISHMGGRIIVECTLNPPIPISGSGVIIVATYSALPTVADGRIAYVQDTDIFYGRVNGAWMQFGGTYVVDTKTSLPVVADGSFGYTLDTDRFYGRSQSAWVCLSHFEVP